jgi:hypothetical protein
MMILKVTLFFEKHKRLLTELLIYIYMLHVAMLLNFFK